ncbi:MAG: MarR family winged helix-turn-helix transcriptional regulator [Alphaproteobacteria bacterium]|nr:MarR family winged helix-turn-helix transcriptional regulator [Alphaproteobacteria bacterium]MBU2085547.1 MarR family winged helix-turn-helix transcriptional regulator [Alphaproteobacteria bacterium]MBU2141703.1 MarR family winged helix-turn-helix transcriptional regulator [Alphaproteobacteria bacterium]MBU2197666.1 MarR family winged helix-turn-helix transcriptional regulator [Alphaproteobacteria bacterium]
MTTLTPKQQTLFTLFNEIGIISQLSSVRFERILPHGLTIAQFSVLNHLVRLDGDWSPARLAAAFQVTKGTMTSTLQRLVTKGFISLEPDPADGRAKHVVLTDAGRLARETALSAAGPALGDLNAALSPSEIDALIPGLQKLRVWLDINR